MDDRTLWNLVLRPREANMPEDVWQYLVRARKEFDKRDITLRPIMTNPKRNPRIPIGTIEPSKEMKKQYVEMIMQHSMIPGYIQKLNNKIINMYGWDFYNKLVYEVEADWNNSKRNPISYTKATQTPKGGWVRAGPQHQLATASDIVGRRLAIYPESIYKQALKKGMSGRELLDLTIKDPEKVMSLALGWESKPNPTRKVGDYVCSYANSSAFFQIKSIKGDLAIIKQVDNLRYLPHGTDTFEVPIKFLLDDYPGGRFWTKRDELMSGKFKPIYNQATAKRNPTGLAQHKPLRAESYRIYLPDGAQVSIAYRRLGEYPKIKASHSYYGKDGYYVASKSYDFDTTLDGLEEYMRQLKEQGYKVKYYPKDILYPPWGPYPKRNPLPLYAAIPLVTSGVATAYKSIPTELKVLAGIGLGVTILGVGDVAYTWTTGKPGIIHRSWRSLPYFGGAAVSATANKYLVPEKYKVLKYATAIGTLGLLGLGVYKMFQD